MKLLLKTVNKQIKYCGLDAELVKGDGYFYFIGADVEHAYSTSIMVYRLNDLSLSTWVEEAQTIASISKERKLMIDEVK